MLHFFFAFIIFIKTIIPFDFYSIKLNFGDYGIKEINDIIYEGNLIKPESAKIEYFSNIFSRSVYKSNTLSGSQEIFTVNFQELDCFTYIDYVEALRRSVNIFDFLLNLKSIRYKDSSVNYISRNHFFSNWQAENSKYISDVTLEIGGQKIKFENKFLNIKKNGSSYVENVPSNMIKRSYIPSKLVDKNIVNKLINGDYIGIYSSKAGLDVSHVGILIIKNNRIYIRHASSLKKYRKIIDSDFKKYISDKEGFIIFRVKT